jgi:hypothetical protein
MIRIQVPQFVFQLNLFNERRNVLERKQEEPEKTTQSAILATANPLPGLNTEDSTVQNVEVCAKEQSKFITS